MHSLIFNFVYFIEYIENQSLIADNEQVKIIDKIRFKTDKVRYWLNEKVLIKYKLYFDTITNFHMSELFKYMEVKILSGASVEEQTRIIGLAKNSLEIPYKQLSNELISQMEQLKDEIIKLNQ